MYVCNGILLQPSRVRGAVRPSSPGKITRGGQHRPADRALPVHGNLDVICARSGAMCARLCARMQWMMLQQDTAEDFVIASPAAILVREFILWSAGRAWRDLRFEATGSRRAIVDAIQGELAFMLSTGAT